MAKNNIFFCVNMKWLLQSKSVLNIHNPINAISTLCCGYYQHKNCYFYFPIHSFYVQISFRKKRRIKK